MVQCDNPNIENTDNCVSSQTDDTLGENCLPHTNAMLPSINVQCRKCAEENSHSDAQDCKHNNPPVPLKPTRWRHARHKDHTHFDRAQPPGFSRSSNDIQGMNILFVGSFNG